MADPQRTHEPTMEEILASIRRIISDDEVAAEPAVVEEEETPSAELDADTPAEEEENSNEDVDALFAGDDEEENSNEDVDALFAGDDDEENSNEDVDALFADTADEVAAESEEDLATPEPESEEAEVFELTDAMAAPDLEADDETGDNLDALLEGLGDGDEAASNESLSDDDISFEDPIEEDEPAPFPVNDLRPVEQAALLSSDAQTTTSAAFGALASTMLSHSGGARTLEQIVEDMLKPLLKAWLDESLPPLVERLVREEIERVARQAR